MNKLNQFNQDTTNDDRAKREDISKDLRVSNRHKIKTDFDYSNERRPYDNSSETRLRSFQETHFRKTNE